VELCSQRQATIGRRALQHASGHHAVTYQVKIRYQILVRHGGSWNMFAFASFRNFRLQW
jgi:hypothetical protein